MKLKLPRRRLPKPNASRQRLLAAAKKIESSMNPNMPNKRAANRFNELLEASMQIRNAIDMKRYKQGFKILADLRAKERKREWWTAHKGKKKTQ